MERDKGNEPSRRTVVISSVTGLASIWLASNWPGILAAQEHAHAVAKSAAPATFQFFSPDQAVEVESITAQIIPTDDSPGAREAGAVYFIDRALTTFDQDKQTTYAEGLTGLRTKTQELFPNANKFSELNSAQQIQLLTAIEHSAFFAQVRLHTIVGFFANPEYGGNREKIGWNLIGFDDKFDWQPPFGYYDREYLSASKLHPETENQ